MRRAPIVLLLAVAAAVDGCSCDKVPSAAVTACEQSAVVPGAVKTDILFVVDDSGSMSQEQTNLANNLQAFIQALKDSPIANDFQVGVTTTSVQDFDGTLTGAQGALIGSPAVLSGSQADLVTVFSARVQVGTGGTGKEQPFRAMRLALSDPLLSGTNAGFLRPGARLAVVFLSDEDDCSDSGPTYGITDTTTNGGNDQCHNDGADGVDYKFGKIDPIDDYTAFLKGPIGGEVRDVVLAAIVGVDAVTKAPTCGNTGNSWCCGGTSATIDTCTENSRTSFTQTIPASSSLTGTTVCCGGTAGTCGGATGTACTSPCNTAYDKADRYGALLARFGGAKTLEGSVCDSSFASTLELIAGLIVSQTLPLEGAPADPQMLVVGVRHPDGSRTSCTVRDVAAPDAATADAVYEAPAGGQPAKLTFQNACTLDRGDKIEIDVICAG